MYKKFLKRIFDFIFSFLVLIIFSPIMLSIIIVLFFVNKGSLFFVQERPGKNGKLFKIIKFKTMIDERYRDGKLINEYDRITKVGRIIRDYSLDELLQFINILKGDMSLIGPRPLLIDYLPLYNERQNKRHDVRPGITGWSQVNGRNAISWSDRFEQDVWYVENLSFILDLKIFFLTILKIFKREGVYLNEKTTMTKWMGNNEQAKNV